MPLDARTQLPRHLHRSVGVYLPGALVYSGELGGELRVLIVERVARGEVVVHHLPQVTGAAAGAALAVESLERAGLALEGDRQGLRPSGSGRGAGIASARIAGCWAG